MEQTIDFEKIVPQLKVHDPVAGITPLTQTPDSWVYTVESTQPKTILRISTTTPERDDGLTSAEGMEQRISALKLGKGILGLEQLVDYSFEHEAVLTRHAPGTLLSDLSPVDAEAVNKKHLEAVVRTLRQSASLGICIDSFPSNIFFHREQGFTFIDYGISEEEPSSAQTEYATFLQTIGGDLVTPDDSTAWKKAWLQTLEEGLDIFQNTFRARTPSVLALYHSILRGYLPESSL